MQVIAKRQVKFHHPEKPRVSHLVLASKDAQEVPEWVRDTAGFSLARKDGTVREVIFKDVHSEEDDKSNSEVKSSKHEKSNSGAEKK